MGDKVSRFQPTKDDIHDPPPPGVLPIVTAGDPVNHPPHYTKHPSGVECISVTEHMNFCLGNAVKYIWRADLKGGIEDLRKAEWYIKREIERRVRSEGH